MKVSANQIGCSYMRSQSRDSVAVTRLSMCEARCGAWIQGRIKKRVLYAINRTLRLRACWLQPMKRSRLPRCRGAELQAMQATGLPLRPHQIFQVLTHRLLVAKVVMILDEAIEQRFIAG